VANTAILGGGMLGLELARKLRASGDTVTVLEAAPHLGGLASAWQLGGVTWDKHYHVVLLSDLNTQALLADLGLRDDFVGVTTKTGFYTDGKLYSMSNTVEFLRFPPLGLLSKLRLGGTIFLASRIKDWKRLEGVPVADWLRRWSGRRTFERIWLPLLRSKLGEGYRQTSAAFIWATIARMYAARRSGLKKEVFGYVRGGYARVLARFAEVLSEAGVTIQTDAAVESVAQQSDSVRVTLSNGHAEEFDRVVLTAPTHVVSKLVPQLTPGEHARLNAVKYQGIVCASVLLTKPLERFYVTNITESWVPFTAVIEMSALVDRAEFGGHSLIYLPKYVAPDDAIFDESDESIRARFVAALARMYPHFDPADVIDFRVSRVRSVFALATLNYSATVPPMATSLPGVYVVNSAQIVNGTLNVNETLGQAAAAAKALAEARVPVPASGVA